MDAQDMRTQGARSHVCARFPSFLLPRSEDSLSRAAHSQRGGAGEKRRTNFRPIRRRQEGERGTGGEKERNGEGETLPRAAETSPPTEPTERELQPLDV